MLTTEQISFFEIFGFLCLRQLFSSAEMADFARESEELMESNPGERTGPTHQAVSPFVELGSTLKGLPEDDRIYLPMEQLLGPGFIWGGSEGVSGSFNETNDHNWHSDRAGQIDLQYMRIKIMIYLQPMRKETGALRVIPGSHHAPFHRGLLPLHSQHEEACPGTFGVSGADLCSHPLEVDPGDVVVFNHYLFHAVYGKQETRRYIALKFAAEPKTEAEYNALRPNMQDASQLDVSYRDSDRPRVQGMVAKLLEWEAKLG